VVEHPRVFDHAGFFFTRRCPAVAAAVEILPAKQTRRATVVERYVRENALRLEKIMMDKGKDKVRTGDEIAAAVNKHAAQTVVDKTKNGIKKEGGAIKVIDQKMDGLKK